MPSMYIVATVAVGVAPAGMMVEYEAEFHSADYIACYHLGEIHSQTHAKIINI